MTGVRVGAQESDERLLGDRRFPPRHLGISVTRRQRRIPLARNGDRLSRLAASASEWTSVGLRALAATRERPRRKRIPTTLTRNDHDGAALPARARLVASVFRQQTALVFGCVAWSGQPCQQQPSTKTVRRCALKTKSGFTWKAFTFSPATFHWSEAPRPQPVMPWARKIARAAARWLRCLASGWPTSRRSVFCG